MPLPDPHPLCLVTSDQTGKIHNSSLDESVKLHKMTLDNIKTIVGVSRE